MTEPYSPSAEKRFYPPSREAARLSAGEPPGYNRSNSLAEPGRPNRQNSVRSLPPYEPNGDVDIAADEKNALGNDKERNKIKETQAMLNEATGQMRDNIVEISKRGETLEHLQDRTDSLSLQSQNFKVHATKVRRRMWWKNAKWTICICVFLVVVVAGAVGGYEGKKHVDHEQTAAPSGPTETTIPAQPAATSN